MRFKTVADMQQDIYSNLWRIPETVDVVVGVPRSGMLAASIIALSRNLPLSDIESFCSGRTYTSGSTRRGNTAESPRHALIVDDSSRTGSALSAARQAVMDAQVSSVTTFAVIYGTSATSLDTTVFCMLDGPRIFEWNVLHHPGILERAMLDIDGVLCHDPLDLENDDGPRYRQFLVSAKPLHLPSHYVSALVTSRLEKYRPETETWLAEHSVNYGRLIMLDLPDAASRRSTNAHGRHKATHYAESEATLFVESDAQQAREIASISGKPVLSLEGPFMAHPSALAPRSLKQTLRNRVLLKEKIRLTLGDRTTNRLRDTYRRINGSRKPPRTDESHSASSGHPRTEFRTPRDSRHTP